VGIVKINTITVPRERFEEFERRFAARAGRVSGAPSVYRSSGHGGVWFGWLPGGSDSRSEDVRAPAYRLSGDFGRRR
jgi:hypothetical protein